MNYLIDSTLYFSFIFARIEFKNRYSKFFILLLILSSYFLKINMFELNINTIAFLLISFVLLAHYNLRNEIELFYIMALYLVLGSLSSQIITYMLFILQSSEKSVILFLLKNSLLVYILTRIAIIFIF